MSHTIQIPKGKERLSIPVSMVKGARGNKIVKISTLESVFNGITDNNNSQFKEFSNKLKTLREKDLKAYRELKTKECHGFIVGEYEKRADKYCQKYFSLIGFDIDGLTETPLEVFLGDLRESPFVFAVFPSPSFRGIRIFFWCESSKENHKAVYQSVCRYLSNFLQIPTDKDLRKQGKSDKEIKELTHIDSGTNNISRIWFFSHVPADLFHLNLESSVFIPNSIQKTNKRPHNTGSVSVKETISNDEKIELCLKKVNAQDIPGGRNNFVFSLACECCRFGVPQNMAMVKCLEYREENFEDSEIKKTVLSAYKSKQFGEFSDGQILKYKSLISQDLNHSNKPGIKSTVTAKKVQGEEIQEPTTKETPKFVKLERYLLYNYEFRRNIVSLEIEYRPKKSKGEFEIVNADDLNIELWRVGFKGIEQMVKGFLKSKKIIPNYDPFEDYFKGLPKWKKNDSDHIIQLAQYIILKDEKRREWFNEQFKKTLIRMVACSLLKIPFNKQCFTLISDQNDGKTTFLRFLSPPKLKHYHKENLNIYNKDGEIELISNFTILFDEMDAFSKSDLNKAKALFTREIVKERFPYERVSVPMRRRANFFATHNSAEFLTDETGNVRWLVFEIAGINHDDGGPNGYNQNIDIDKVWAQAFALLESGFKFNMTKKDIQQSEENNKSHIVKSIEQLFILRTYSPATKAEFQKEQAKLQEGQKCEFTFKQTIDILDEINIALPRQASNINKIGRALKALGYERDKLYMSSRGMSLPGYFLKEIKEDEIKEGFTKKRKNYKK